MGKLAVFYLALCCVFNTAWAMPLLESEAFTSADSVLVCDESGATLLDWQADKMMMPASLAKLATAYLAVDKWGVSHRFFTDYYMQGNDLWVRGYGDPFIVSEELDAVVLKLKQKLTAEVKTIHIDNSHFQFSSVPGRTNVSDPYNAPLSAVAVNFNTAKLRRHNGQILSAESQTPLTATAAKLAKNLSKKSERVNLQTVSNAQTNFAQLLAIKLGLSKVAIKIDQKVADNAVLIYRHENSHTLADVLRGTLEFSNNFMANQVFLQFGQQVPLNFIGAQSAAEEQLSRKLNWSSHRLVEGSGLSRDNRLSARQIDNLLEQLSSHKELLKEVEHPNATIYAKTGTLDGVRSYAGFIKLANKNYRFVFIFNRTMPWRYREQVLDRLVNQLNAL
ncbi:MAG: D-alanyl-D-alanine carboxypeptidase/D-alanyl-D-alanine-endopeptidase (penicillin-binding protein 4) [Cryomorphaceae bacterium]|jgi:D-alanyl-D-alanine carboxypeptidase/D-alanyl-D-alanine-endopeptidase (penicillin-binding protein 4)